MDSETSTSRGPAEHRHDTRTHLFVIATLCWNEGSSPVHVRNMSANGALIEAAILPKPGSLVVLKRGSLEVSSRIAWSTSRQAGLAFGSTVRVSDWMARRANAHQDRIDEIVSALKSDAIGDEHKHLSIMGSDLSLAVETELTLLRSDLTQLGNGLAADVVLVATHPEIQLIDIALQRIERILRTLG